MSQPIKIEMPVNAYYFLLKSVPCPEPLLIPHHTINQDEAAQAYVQAREYWMRSKWVDMDLDGSLLPYPVLDRLLYTLSKRQALLRWEREDYVEYSVRGPVDLLRVTEREDWAVLAQEPRRCLVERIFQALDAGCLGTMEVLRMSDQESVRLSDEDTNRREIAERILSLFLEEADNA